DRTVILIGPDGLRKLPTHVLAPVRHIVTPDRDAFDVVDWLTQEGLGAIVWSRDRAPVVAVSAGPAAKIVVDRLALHYPSATIIDFGSVWDPYAGRTTRTYHRAILAREAVAQ
ncbi:MAG TPA: hypothetical protein VFO31_05060, partial [Vicinamibacterales bacterium]|nr:hypothetical protein [Vicinamibacterales bacterium]